MEDRINPRVGRAFLLKFIGEFIRSKTWNMLSILISCEQQWRWFIKGEEEILII